MTRIRLRMAKFHEENQSSGPGYLNGMIHLFAKPKNSHVFNLFNESLTVRCKYDKEQLTNLIKHL